MEEETEAQKPCSDGEKDLEVGAIDAGSVPCDTLQALGQDVQEMPLIGNTADVAYQIRQVNQLLAEVAAYKTQANEAADFYANRIKGLMARADMLKENVGRWLKMNSLKKLATHSGTIYFTKKKNVIWCADADLLAFIKQQDTEVQDKLRNISPNKTALKQYIESTGKIPDGYRAEEAEAIAIRKVA